MPFDVHPLTPKRWPDLEAVFQAKGCAMARSCWCLYYRVSGNLPSPPSGQTRQQHLRARFEAIVTQGPPPGLLAYDGDSPVGWMALGPREVYARLAKSPVMKPVDDLPVWSITCFVVPPQHRRQGVARALLQAAILYAQEQGATMLEAYPVDRREDPISESLWFGTLSMYEEAGFAEVARRKRGRPVVRRALDAPAKTGCGLATA
jgi:GNAT superfamily N-acetyltransferase